MNEHNPADLPRFPSGRWIAGLTGQLYADYGGSQKARGVMIIAVYMRSNQASTVKRYCIGQSKGLVL